MDLDLLTIKTINHIYVLITQQYVDTIIQMVHQLVLIFTRKEILKMNYIVI